MILLPSNFRCMKLLFTLLPLTGLIFAQDPVQKDAAQRGQQQYKKSCSFCHGASADGGAEGPSLIRSALLRHDNNGDLIGPVIHEGRPEKGMPPIPLTPAQIADTVAFLHAQLKRLDRTSPGKPPRDHYTMDVLLTGNAEAGKKYFEGACAACHSPTGDLAGIAKKFAPADLQTRFLYPIGKPSAVTVTLASGAQVQGTLVTMDAFFVSMKDADGWPHSWPLSAVKVEVKDPLAAHRVLLKKITNADIHNLFGYLVTL
jgi:cytochrome c oxidase cbb3-type subunit 3